MGAVNVLKKVAGAGSVALGLGLMGLAIGIVLTPIIAMGTTQAIITTGGAAADVATPPTPGVETAIGALGGFLAGSGIAITAGPFALTWAVVLFAIGALFVAIGLGALGVSIKPITDIIEGATPFDEAADIAGALGGD